jgi:hypothetical protein
MHVFYVYIIHTYQIIVLFQLLPCSGTLKQLKYCKITYFHIVGFIFTRVLRLQKIKQANMKIFKGFSITTQVTLP